MVRTVGNAGKEVHDFLEEIAASLHEPGLTDVALYNNAAISGDFVLALLWDTEKPLVWGSNIGLGFVNDLKRLGLVDHSVWTRIGERCVKNTGSRAGRTHKGADL